MAMRRKKAAATYADVENQTTNLGVMVHMLNN